MFVYKIYFSSSQRQNDMEQAVAIATTLAGQFDIAIDHIKQLKTELRESRALNDKHNRELQQQQPDIHITSG